MKFAVDLVADVDHLDARPDVEKGAEKGEKDEGDHVDEQLAFTPLRFHPRLLLAVAGGGKPERSHVERERFHRRPFPFFSAARSLALRARGLVLNSSSSAVIGFFVRALSLPWERKAPFTRRSSRE